MSLAAKEAKFIELNNRQDSIHDVILHLDPKKHPTQIRFLRQLSSDTQKDIYTVVDEIHRAKKLRRLFRIK